MEKLTAQRGIEFLQIILSELSMPSVFSTEDASLIADMFTHMQDPETDDLEKTKDDREKHFPRFMKALYKNYTEIPQEFKEYASDALLYDLVTNFVRNSVQKDALKDMVKRPDAHAQEYLLLNFQFFGAMEDAKIQEIAQQEGRTVQAPAVLEIQADGSLAIITGEELIERKKNQKTQIESWNPYGADDIDAMHEVCRKKGEIQVISQVLKNGFEIKNVIPVAESSSVKIIAENRNTEQKIEIYIDDHGQPKHIIDLANPHIRKDVADANWQDELAILVSNLAGHPDQIADRAEELSSRGPLKSDPRSTITRHEEIALNDDLFVEPEPTEETVEIPGTSQMQQPGMTYTAGPQGGFNVISQTVSPDSKQVTQNDVRTMMKESRVKEPARSSARATHRPRLTQEGETTGRTQTPTQNVIKPKKKHQPKKKVKAKKKTTLADSALKWSGVAAGLGSTGIGFTSFLI